VAEPIQLTTPHLLVKRQGADPLDVQTTNADLVLWDKTRFRHKWPTVGDAPFLWLTFIGWAAARRTGAIGPDVTYESWEGSTLEIETLGDDEDDADDGLGLGIPDPMASEYGRPTRLGPVPG
jgi:hypothetical protein